MADKYNRCACRDCRDPALPYDDGRLDVCVDCALAGCSDKGKSKCLRRGRTWDELVADWRNVGESL